MEVLHPQLAQDVRDLLVSRAVEGGVHHGEGVRHLGHTGLVVDLGQDVLQECFIGLLPQEGDQALVQGLLVVHGTHAVKHVQLLHLLGDGGSVLGGKLGPVGPIHLVAVVLRRVVAGGDVEPGDAAVLPHGKGELRGGPHGLEQPHGDAVGRHHPGGRLGEFLGVDPAVVADGHPLGGGLRPLRQDHLGKGLGGVADHMDVHPPQAHAHHPTEAGGAEL